MENQSLYTTIEVITPELAQIYLTHNVGNRKLNKDIVNLYVEQMKNGEWLLSNDAISFSKEGRLLNGQHRLKAVCDSGVSCQFNVIRGLDDKAFAVMDNGKNRSACDVFFIEGVIGATVIASAIKRKFILERKRVAVHSSINNGGASSSTKVANMQILSEYNSKKDYYDNLWKDIQALYRKSRLLTQSDYGGFIAYLSLSLKHPYDTALAFFKEFVEIDKPTNDVISLLRQKLLNDRLSNLKMSSFIKQQYIIKAWNAYVTGKTVKKLIYTESSDKDLWFV